MHFSSIFAETRGASTLKVLDHLRAYLACNGPGDRPDTATDVGVFFARSSDEVHPKHVSPDERADFVAADAVEWKAIMDSGSVRVLNPVAADIVRRERPDRVMNSRMVRRRKPQEGTFQKPKAKFRWCVFTLFFFLQQVCGLTLSLADPKNAFCQSNSLDRSAGPLYVEPCEGSELATWIAHPTRRPSVRPQRRTTTMASHSDGLAHQARISKIHAGTVLVCVHNAPGGSVDGLIVLEVDDFSIGSKRSQEAEFQRRFQAAFRFGKWQKREASYAGRRRLVRSCRSGKSTSWRSFIQCSCVRNSRRTEGLPSTSSNVSTHWCARSAGLPRKVAPRLQGPRPSWRNT